MKTTWVFQKELQYLNSAGLKHRLTGDEDRGLVKIEYDESDPNLFSKIFSAGEECGQDSAIASASRILNPVKETA